tara:strand:+ start:22 stop:360 length:339 start_codon:yes stop_codon:yes gene_type:complete
MSSNGNNQNQNPTTGGGLATFLGKEHPSLSTVVDGENNVPTNETLILAIATGLGAWGGFPAPPKGFNRIVSNELVQYALVFVLLMQGGAGKNYKLAGLVTGIMYALHKILDN